MSKWKPLAQSYDPIKCGSIDGTDETPHDKALIRALNANFKPVKNLPSDSTKTLFVSRIHHKSTEDDLKNLFSVYGKIKSIHIVCDIVTGFPKGYAFIEYIDKKYVQRAMEDNEDLVLYGRPLLVDAEFGHNMENWVPRRLGGGFGGKKESGQLRFGCRDRPFKRPINMYPDYRHKYSKKSKFANSFNKHKFND